MASFVSLRDLVNNHHGCRPSRDDQMALHPLTSTSGQAQSLQQLIQGNSATPLIQPQLPVQSIPQGQQPQLPVHSFSNKSVTKPPIPDHIPISAQVQTSKYGLPTYENDKNFHMSKSTTTLGYSMVVPDPVVVLPSTPSIGQDETFEQAWGFLGDDKVWIVGIYGMGGVGKTTLLKQINNGLEGTCDFDVVIWVVVSKEVNMSRIHKTILERLDLPHCDDILKDQVAILKALRRRKFVLFLDDLWERLDLEDLGVPAPSKQNMCKVLFTTRSEDVCGQMRYHRKIEVKCLIWKEAWDLFQKYVGEEALNCHSEVPMLAQKVAKDCGGLPLALIVIARAMTSKRTPQEWKHALTILRNAPSKIPGARKDLYYRLKFSYDMLPNDAIRSCFLYCSLFPKDHLIKKEKLINYWKEEGFLDGCESIDEAVNLGYDVIGILKVSCLLESLKEMESHDEECHVKMHYVIRDMALWVASECGVNKGKFLVRAGIGLHKAPEIETGKDIERMSLMDNKINTLLGTPVCPRLLTLMLQFNRGLKISNEFFQFMPLLRVLDLSNTDLRELPTSIGQLVELQYLNVSHTYLKWVPKEMGDLQNLRHLDMSNIQENTEFPPQTISNLAKLQVLDMRSNNPKYEELIISELESLNLLSDLSIRIRNFSSVLYLIGSQTLAQCITNLEIHACPGIKSLHLQPCFGTKLRSLYVGYCDSLEFIEIGGQVDVNNQYEILPCLESLILYHNPKLKRIRVVNSLGQCLQHLRIFSIVYCKLLEEFEWVKHLQSLKYFCKKEN